MGNTEHVAEPVWTEAESALQAAAQSYFEAIAACAAEGGRVQEAIMAAMPAEVREQMPMLGALGL